jgi:hydrogenase expression/formation protein HypC
MCLGIPGEVVDVRDDGGLRIGTVRFAGITRDVCLDYVPDAAVGEYVLVHVGFAISKINPEEAARTYRVLEELGQTGELTADRELVEPPP